MVGAGPPAFAGAFFPALGSCVNRGASSTASIPTGALSVLFSFVVTSAPTGRHSPVAIHGFFAFAAVLWSAARYGRTLTLDVSDLDLRAPIARTDDAWIAFGFDEDLDAAAVHATETMLDLMERELGIARNEALAVASVSVDLHVTQVVNVAKGVHAILRA